ncbi:MAG: hypothetical protein ACLGG9_00330 [Thermoleophilia bacterium]
MTPRRPLGRRPAPTGRRATIIGVVLSLLIPGLGHAYLGHLTRALIWFAGTVLLAIVVGGGDENAGLALAMGVAIGACAAIDTLVIRRTG